MSENQREESVSRAELEVADTVGRLMHFWGFKRRMGRLWTLLYLSPEPLGAAELSERMKMSAGSVSMTLADLLKWGAIKKTWRPGDRRDYYECETSIWKLLRRVLRERELTLVRDVRETLETAEATLAQAGNGRRLRQIEFKRGEISILYEPRAPGMVMPRRNRGTGTERQRHGDRCRWRRAASRRQCRR